MIRSVLAVAAVALVVATSARPAASLVCGTIPEHLAVIERTIAGRQPMGGEFDVVVIGVVEAIGPTDADGYREVALDVGAVLRGTAARKYAVKYPASADEPTPMFIPGATYLVAVESKGWTGGPTTDQCSATSRIIEPEQIERYIGMSTDPIVYSDAIPTLADRGGQPLVPLGALLAIVLASGVIWIAWQRGQHRSPER